MTARLPDTSAERHYAQCMDIWLRWMHGSLPSVDYSGIDSVCGRSQTNFMAAEDDSDIVYEKADWKLAETVNACVESLMPSERLAIYIKHDLARHWPFRNLDQASCLAIGTVTLKRLIAKRC